MATFPAAPNLKTLKKKLDILDSQYLEDSAGAHPLAVLNIENMKTKTHDLNPEGALQSLENSPARLNSLQKYVPVDPAIRKALAWNKEYEKSDKGDLPIYRGLRPQTIAYRASTFLKKRITEVGGKVARSSQVVASLDDDGDYYGESDSDDDRDSSTDEDDMDVD